MNKALFRMEWQHTWKLLVLFMLILTMYISLIMTMYDPELGTALKEFEKAMPEIMAAVGMSGDSSTLISFMSTYLYGMIMILFPFLFSVITAIRLLVRKVDNGSMAYLLSSGVKRSTVWRSELMVLWSALFALLLYATGIGIVCGMLLFPGELDVWALLRLNLGCFFLHTALAAICFLASSYFSEVRYAAIVGAGFSILEIMIQMLANMKGNLENLKYATILTFFDAEGLIENTGTAWLGVLALAMLALLCFLMAHQCFVKRDLSL